MRKAVLSVKYPDTDTPQSLPPFASGRPADAFGSQPFERHHHTVWQACPLDGPSSSLVATHQGLQSWTHSGTKARDKVYRNIPPVRESSRPLSERDRCLAPG